MWLSQGACELIGIQSPGRRARRLRLSRRFRQRIFWRDGGKCVYCDRPVEFAKCTMDHVTPLVRRGRSRSKENIVTSCESCNRKKGPLELETLDDLAPEMLWTKFDKVAKDTSSRKGNYRDYIDRVAPIAGSRTGK